MYPLRALPVSWGMNKLFVSVEKILKYFFQKFHVLAEVGVLLTMPVSHRQ
jgi:hypothetical protein